MTYFRSNQSILETGLIGGCLFVAIFAIIMLYARSSASSKFVKVACVMVFTYVIMGIVEITFSLTFLLWWAIVIGFSSENKRDHKSFGLKGENSQRGNFGL